jgi:hypothetical protein
MSAVSNKREAAIRRALELVTEAIDLLDAHDGPPDATANLSLAQEQLRQILSGLRK